MFEFTPRPAAAHHAHDTTLEDSVLESPAWSALSGVHARFAEGDDYARRYAADASPFVGVVSWEEPQVWESLIALFGHGAEVPLSHFVGELPEGWTEISRGDGMQLVASDRVSGQPFDDAVELGEGDVDEMLALIERNRPGPFRARTYQLGRYVGVRREGRLIAMAGERLHPQGFTEISAVSVDDEYRRRGLASALTLDVAYAIRQRGDVPFLHASAANTGAIATYEKLGFQLRRMVTFLHARTPEAAV